MPTGQGRVVVKTCGLGIRSSCRTTVASTISALRTRRPAWDLIDRRWLGGHWGIRLNLCQAGTLTLCFGLCCLKLR